MAKRVYFAFHYRNVIDFRANVVRKHNFVGGVEVTATMIIRFGRQQRIPIHWR